MRSTGARGSVRQHRGADERRRLVEEFLSSGCGPGEFCQSRGLSKESLNRWRRECVTAEEVPATAAPVRSASFVELGSIAHTSGRASGRLDLRLDLGGGVVLHLVRG